jgi:hypothetical protein
MMNISLAGLLGAIAGTILAAVSYHAFIDVLDREVRKRAQPPLAEQRDSFEMTLSMMRRFVLTVDLIVFAAAGYWIARRLWD